MRKVLADMHIPAAWRRWATRLVLAIAVALAVAYIPWRITTNANPADKLEVQLGEIRTLADELEVDNARLDREIRALRTDPQAIEDHARDQLGMVYPDELVIKIEAVR